MPSPAATSEKRADIAFLRRVFIVVAVGALVAAVWALADIILLLFGAILFAVMLHALAAPLRVHIGLGPRSALGLAGAGLIVLLAAAGMYFGPELVAEMRTVASTLPSAANRIVGELGLGTMADLVRDGTAGSALGALASRVIAWSTTIAGGLASAVLLIFGGIYLAIAPALYRDGLLKLVPPAIQPNVSATLDDAGKALRLWLKGQLLAMVLVGIFTGLGLWLVGVPSAFALGVIAGLAEFVPIIGPILAAIPALLVASNSDLQTVLLALAVLVAVQQLESNLITPFIVDRMVSIAPAVGLFAVVAMGVLFGPLGLLLGFPLAIVFDVAVRRLYVHDTLGEAIKIGGSLKPAK
jgi:predicted PurR-regulated permease PerM